MVGTHCVVVISGQLWLSGLSRHSPPRCDADGSACVRCVGLVRKLVPAAHSPWILAVLVVAEVAVDAVG